MPGTRPVSARAAGEVPWNAALMNKGLRLDLVNLRLDAAETLERRPDEPGFATLRRGVRGWGVLVGRLAGHWRSAPLPPFGHPPPRLRTQERDGTRKAAGKRDNWVGENEVPPSPRLLRLRLRLRRGMRGRGVGAGGAVSVHAVPPSLAFGHPSPAASRAGEGRERGMLRVGP